MKPASTSGAASELAILDAGELTADPELEAGFAGSAHQILAELVRAGAALGWVGPPSPDEVAELLGRVAAAARAGDGALRAAYIGRRLVGLGYWLRYARPTHRPHADLEKIAVDAACQGRGVGRALTAALIADAGEAGIEVLTLDARGDNSGALRLYRSLGFTEYGRLPDFVAVGEHRYDKVFCMLDLRRKTSGGRGSSGTNMARMSEQPARWTRATVYPDMWADPDDDPRNSNGGGAGPEGELATLQDFLRDYRLTLRMKCEGLDAEQLARRSVPPSTMSLLGLLRHLAEVERDWRNWISDADPLPRLYGGSDADFDGAVADQAVVDAAYADLEREQGELDAALAGHPDLGERLGKEGIAVRELMVHRIDEYARHCGHADLLRECVDGRVGQ